nr:MAG TPA: hypothetical protein [Caudoviricetes sp.]
MAFVTYFSDDILCCHNRISFNCYYFLFDDAKIVLFIIQNTIYTLINHKLQSYL